MSRKVPRNRPTANKRSNKQSSLRIIGGQWRSRKLPFVDVEGLRPTPDRVRETLFNWLQTHIHGAYCLDLFAGSGALGFEALSRGASQVVFVEKSSRGAKQLIANADLLGAQAQVLNCDALQFHSALAPHAIANQQAFDIIFLDPPFRQDLLPKSLTYLQQQGFIGAQTLIYAEHEAEEVIDWQAFQLTEQKHTKAGQVHSTLLTVTAVL